MRTLKSGVEWISCKMLPLQKNEFGHFLEVKLLRTGRNNGFAIGADELDATVEVSGRIVQKT